MASTSIKEHYSVRKGLSIYEDKGSKASTSKHDKVEQKSSNKFDEDMEILKQFDLTWQYGPSIGMTRLERWERAEKYGLSPPQNVKDLLVDHANNEQYTHCLWNEYNTLI